MEKRGFKFANIQTNPFPNIYFLYRSPFSQIYQIYPLLPPSHCTCIPHTFFLLYHSVYLDYISNFFFLLYHPVYLDYISNIFQFILTSSYFTLFLLTSSHYYHFITPYFCTLSPRLYLLLLPPPPNFLHHILLTLWIFKNPILWIGLQVLYVSL